MEKNIRLYRQRGDTCAIVCMMMVLEYYKIIDKANWYDEKRLYKIYGSKHMSGTPFSALAYHMSKNGLKVTLYHEDINLFNNNYGVLDNYDFELSMNEYKENLNIAKKSGTTVINGIDININLLKEMLDEDNFIILAGELSGRYHAILLIGYDEKGFIVCDPLYKDKQVRTFEEIEKYMDTSIGKWFISVNDNL